MRRPRKKYITPPLFEKARIEEDHALMREYGLKNLRELLIARAELRKIRRAAREAIAGKIDIKPLIARAIRIGFVKEGAGIDDLLALNVRNVLDRRLQTIVLSKGLAKTIRHARQLIAHRKVKIAGQIVTAPGRFITKEEEEKIEVVG